MQKDHTFLTEVILSSLNRRCRRSPHGTCHYHLGKESDSYSNQNRFLSEARVNAIPSKRPNRPSWDRAGKEGKMSQEWTNLSLILWFPQEVVSGHTIILLPSTKSWPYMWAKEIACSGGSQLWSSDFSGTYQHFPPAVIFLPVSPVSIIL